MQGIKGLAALVLAAVVAGCASGGGGRGEVQVTTKPKPSEDAELRCVWFLPFICTWVEPAQEVPPASSAATFKSWAELPPYSFAQATSTRHRVLHQFMSDGSVQVSVVENPATGLFDVPSYDNVGRPDYSPTFQWYRGEIKPTLATLGQPGIDLGSTEVSPRTQKTPFADFFSEIALVANPYILGWNYQSFGVWANSGEMNQVSFGAVTPGIAVPPSGVATFTGKLAGLYVSPNGQGSLAAADVTVSANFATQSLNFTSTGTFTARNIDVKTDAPNLNLSGTLTYTPGSNVFAGTLTNSGGTMTGATSGLFYGPAAEELGGTFALRSPTSPETLSGAYGAKR